MWILHLILGDIQQKCMMGCAQIQQSSDQPNVTNKSNYPIRLFFALSLPLPPPLPAIYLSLPTNSTLHGAAGQAPDPPRYRQRPGS